ncbi:MAG: peptidoglycan editing factor PgeF [Candidatus Omnitrophota bacterium]
MRKKILLPVFKNIKFTKNYLIFSPQFEQKQSERIIIAFSLKNFNYDLRAGENKTARTRIISARQRMFTDLGIDFKKAVFLEQVHKNKVAKINSSKQNAGIVSFAESISGADGAITQNKGRALCLLTADCLPIIFWDPGKKAIGIAHAGWRGTKQAIVRNLLEKMQKQFQSDPAQIKTCFGPGIRDCCYEVGFEFKKIFPDFIRENKKTRRIYLDLIQANTVQMKTFGVREKNIFDLKLCTKCNSGIFYSYRRENTDKRMLSLICRPPDQAEA